jgi:hypothetical protein
VGFFEHIFGNGSGDRSGLRARETESRPKPVWIEPPKRELTMDWQKRLSSFAQKTAGQLRAAKISTYQINGRDSSFSGHFWLIDLDILEAKRSILIRHHPSAPAQRQNQPVNRREGWLSAHALLLSVTGNLLLADVWGSSEFGDGSLNFNDVQDAPDWAMLSAWSWNNKGSWSGDPAGNVSLGSIKLKIQGESWQGRWRHENDPQPGRGASAALKRFASSGGKTGTPRYY